MMCSAYRLNKQGDSRELCLSPFSTLNQPGLLYRALIASWPTYRFLRRQVRWSWSSVPISLRTFHSLSLSTLLNCFGPAASFIQGLLVILLHSSQDLGDSSFGVIYFDSYCGSWGSHGKYTGWFAIPSSSGSHFFFFFVRTLCYDPSVLGNLPGMAYSFTELCKPIHHNKAVIHEGGKQENTIWSGNTTSGHIPWRNQNWKRHT